MRYQSDPVGFVRDCLRFEGAERPAPYQLAALQSLAEGDRVAVRGPRGLGKSALAAWAVWWHSLVWDGRTDWKIITTASVWAQLTNFAWPEIHKWAERIRWGEIVPRAKPDANALMLHSLRLETGEATALASNVSERMEGAHASKLLYIFDEAKIIPAEVWDSVEGAFATGGGKWLALSTPGAPAGRFYQIISGQAPGWVRHRVTLEEAIEAGRVSPEWAEARRSEWGEQDARYQQQVLGEPADDSGGGLIPLGWIEAAQQRWDTYQTAGWRDSRGREIPVSCIAFDVGGGTAQGDASAIAIVRGGTLVERIIKIKVAPDPGVATMHLAGEVKGLLDQYRPRWCFGDSIGIGAGVVARLREQGYNVLPFVANAATTMTDASGFTGHANWRAAGWYGLRELLMPHMGAGVDVALPPDDELTGDLTSVGDAGVNSRNQHMVEKKDAIRARIGRSTDSGDCVMMGLSGPALYTLQAQDAGGQREVVFDPILVNDWR